LFDLQRRALFGSHGPYEIAHLARCGLSLLNVVVAQRFAERLLQTGRVRSSHL